MPPTLHAKLSASSSERWLACPGSIRMSVGVPYKANIYAEEGSAAHAVAERCLREAVDAGTQIGKSVRKSQVDGSFIVCTEDMATAVQVYLDFARAEHKALDSSKMLIEQKFNLNWLHPGMFGTNDLNVFQPYGKMIVADYKHGQGVVVDPENNTQEMYYGLGALGEKNLSSVEETELVIVQPRAPGEKVRRWATTPKDIYTWAQDVLLPGAKLALTEDAPLTAGDHCKFCPALPNCPKAAEKALATASVAFHPQITKREVTLPAPGLLSLEQLEKISEVADLISDWSGAVASELKSRLERGEQGTMFKLVAGRASRKWADETVTIDKLQGVVDVWDQSLLSVAQLEKKLKTAGIPLTVLEGLVTETRGVSLAPIGDKRPALTTVQPFTAIPAAE